MFLLENPVLQRELLVNLRMRRAFALLLAYVGILGAVVCMSWPEAQRIDMTNSEAARRLVNLFFVGQYLIASLMAPSFAAGSISGEKERKSYEMLLASPLAPSAIVLGKLFAALSHLALLIVASLPMVMLCLPLGGVSFYEVLAQYLVLIISVATFGMISLAASSYFQRTASALAVSYLAILPLALAGMFFWQGFGGGFAGVRLVVTLTVLPIVCGALFVVLFGLVRRRLLYPPDLGSEGKEVVDEEAESRQAVGLVIQRDQFPDRLFAPPKRAGLLADGANPVYDKEMRSEIFAQGTLMLRIVIQVSMAVAVPLMAVLLYFSPRLAPWYIAYVILFNMLIGPVFSSGSVTSERERETLDLLLVTLLSPWQILWGKLLSGLRVSSVLTSFLLWPVFLACLMVTYYWNNLLTVAGYVLVVAIVCLTTASIALLASIVFHKTSVAMMTAYLAIVVLFATPPAVAFFASTFMPDTRWARTAEQLTSASPFAAAFALPLAPDSNSGGTGEPNLFNMDSRPANWPVWLGFLGFYVVLDAVLLLVMVRMFHVRWRVSE